MSLHQYIRRHVIVVLVLLLIGYGIVAYIHAVCPEKIGQPHAKGVQVDFAPVYNEDGSTFHARLDIGYRLGLLILESVITLFGSWILYKVVLYYCVFFGMKSWWTYLVDFGCASAIGRLPVRLAGMYVLDYFYIGFRHSTYDFFDFCIGICVVGLLVWLIPACLKYYSYKRKSTKGMGFWERCKWEMRFSMEMGKMLFRPLRSWWKDVS